MNDDDLEGQERDGQYCEAVMLLVDGVLADVRAGLLAGDGATVRARLGECIARCGYALDPMLALDAIQASGASALARPIVAEVVLATASECLMHDCLAYLREEVKRRHP